MICDVVVDCYGRELVIIQAWPDGSYTCPSCNYGVQAHETHCGNPACYTRPGFPVETARKWDAERAQKLAEEERRKRDHENSKRWRQEYQAREQARTVEIIAAAKAAGACVRCALESVRGSRPLKFTKHRKACPHEPKAR